MHTTAMGFPCATCGASGAEHEPCRGLPRGEVHASRKGALDGWKARQADPLAPPDPVESPGPSVYCAGRGVWAAEIPETTLRDIAGQKVENAAVVPTWGVAAFVRAAKEALDRHDADQRREEWVERFTHELFAGLTPMRVGTDGMTADQLRDWLGRQYDRAVGTEE